MNKIAFLSINCVYYFLIFKIIYLFIYLFYLYEYTVAVFRHIPEESIGSHYRWLWATMWLLEIELRTSGRAVSALNLWAISPALFHTFLCEKIPALEAYVFSKKL